MHIYDIDYDKDFLSEFADGDDIVDVDELWENHPYLIGED